MKGSIMHLVLMFSVVILTVILFQLLGEILSKEIEISTLSSKIHSIINEAEFSQKYFKEYMKSFGIKNWLEYKGKHINAQFILENAEDKVVKGKIVILPKRNDINMTLEKRVKLILS